MGLHDKPGTHLPESALQTKHALQIQKEEEEKSSLLSDTLSSVTCYQPVFFH